MHTKRLKILGVLFLIIAAFGVGIYLGVEEHNSNIAAAQTTTPSLNITVTPLGAPQGVDLSQFYEAWNLLNQNFVEIHATGTVPTTQQQIYGAINGLTESFGDPYTVFFSPQDAQIFSSDISGSFGGVGMEMNQDASGNIVVSSPLKGSPAAAAGIEAGDIVTSIDGTSTEGMALDTAVELIRGPVGSTVVLGIRRAGESQPLTISIVRQTIQIPEINYYQGPGGVYVIQLYEFSENSGDLFRDALRAFFQTGDTKLILDLRGNPGGYLDQAVQIASYFLPVGDTVVTEDFEGHQQNIVNESLGYNVFAGKQLSMAVLIDQNSASASEILAGALQQHGVAKLVGTRSFGKGSVQELMDLGGGAELKITVARWLTPNGTSISNGGLTPDINATTTPTDLAAGNDPTMQAAIDWLETQ